MSAAGSSPDPPSSSPVSSPHAPATSASASTGANARLKLLDIQHSPLARRGGPTRCSRSFTPRDAKHVLARGERHYHVVIVRGPAPEAWKRRETAARWARGDPNS